MAERDDLPMTRGDGMGYFHVDHTLHLASGGIVRLEVNASMLVSKQEELDFIYKLVTAVREYERERGIEIGEDVTASDIEGD